MMTLLQLKRLELEKKILERYMPEFQLYNAITNPTVEGWCTPPWRHQNYKLQAVIPQHFPDQKPALYVMYPQVLFTLDASGILNTMGATHAFHTWSPSPEGYVGICIGEWSASHCLWTVMRRGVTWVNAYEKYLLTRSRDIDEIIGEWKRRANENGGKVRLV